MNKYKVLITDEIDPMGLLYFNDDFHVTLFYGKSHEEICAILPEYDALIVRTETNVDALMLDYGARLKVIGRAGVGLDNIDVEYAAAGGVRVFNTPDANTISAAEHTMGMMLAICRHIPQATGGTRQGRWERSSFIGVELHGKTLGIIGTGRIGCYVAGLAQAFGMKVIGYDYHHSGHFTGEYCQFFDLLYESDIISLHLPLTTDTQKLLGSYEFGRMKKGVRLVNCARGGLIDQDALISFYDQGIVAGYATDVFEEEPVLDSSHPFYSRRFITCTPHIGAMTREAQERVSTEICQKIREFFIGS